MNPDAVFNLLINHSSSSRSILTFGSITEHDVPESKHYRVGTTRKVRQKSHRYDARQAERILLDLISTLPYPPLLTPDGFDSLLS